MNARDKSTVDAAAIVVKKSIDQFNKLNALFNEMSKHRSKLLAALDGDMELENNNNCQKKQDIIENFEKRNTQLIEQLEIESNISSAMAVETQPACAIIEKFCIDFSNDSRVPQYEKLIADHNAVLSCATGKVKYSWYLLDSSAEISDTSPIDSPPMTATTIYTLFANKKADEENNPFLRGLKSKM